MADKKKFSLKDHLFNKEKVEYLADLIVAERNSFDKKSFVKDVVSAFPKLELKARIEHISKMLKKYLPDDYDEATKIIIASLPSELDPKKTDNDFGDFIFVPFAEYVSRYGLEKEKLKLSFKTLHEITRRISGEDAIRYFINEFETETLKELEKWVSDSNYHVRRLVSEGTRPSLPWSQKIKLDYRQGLKFLDRLYFDKTRYVTRSVANHMNDISKFDPETVIETLKRWKKSDKQHEKEMDFMVRHSLRTLVKKGHVGALQLLGYDQNPDIEVSSFIISNKRIHLGDNLEFSFKLKASKPTKLLIDYVIEFPRPSGKTSKKVFKLKTLNLTEGNEKVIMKKHPLRKQMTTFKIYPGQHVLILQINGAKKESRSFDIV